MKTFQCTGYHKKNYPVHLSEDDSFNDFFALLPDSQKRFYIIDTHVLTYFPSFVSKINKKGDFIIPVSSSEKNKTFSTLEKISKRIFAEHPSRDDILVAVGGGMITNLGGLTASLIMRGIPFYYVPTTLTGQIDASLGSKIAVNFYGAKNWIGMYNDPEFCYSNIHFLSSIPKGLFHSQAIEGIKLALAADKKLFWKIYDGVSYISILPNRELMEFIEDMIRIKLKIVQKDLLEEAEGYALLYGHTIGHAVEMLSKGKIDHGKAVGLGMLAAAHIAKELGLISSEDADIHEEILHRLSLPYRIPSTITVEDIFHLLQYNKKNYHGDIRFILLREIGALARNNGKYYFTVPKDIIAKALRKCYT